MRNLVALTALAVAGSASAISLPYSTGFETSQFWSAAPNAASNAADAWSGLNNWKMSNAQAFGGSQSLNAGATTTSLPTSVAQPSSITPTNVSIVSANVKMYMASTFNGNATGANAVYGFATRVRDNFGRSHRFAIQNDGTVQLQNNFVYTNIGNLGLTNNAWQNQWLDLSLTLDTTLGSQLGYTFTVKDSAGTQLFTKTASLLTGSTVITTTGVDFIGLLYANNGGSGAALTGNVFYDNYSVEAVPEPGTLAALGIGAMALIRRRRKA